MNERAYRLRASNRIDAIGDLRGLSCFLFCCSESSPASCSAVQRVLLLPLLLFLFSCLEFSCRRVLNGSSVFMSQNRKVQGGSWGACEVLICRSRLHMQTSRPRGIMIPVWTVRSCLKVWKRAMVCQSACGTLSSQALSEVLQRREAEPDKFPLN